MKTFSVDTSIRATPEVVWDLLTDAAGFPGWDTTYTRIDGRIALGETITLHHRVLKPQLLRMKVSAFEPPRRMVWTGGDMPEMMFKGERIFTVAPSADGGVVFQMQLAFSGLMASLILGSVGDMQPLVDAFAHRFNHYRPHDALDGKTPAEYLKAFSAAAQPSHMC